MNLPIKTMKAAVITFPGSNCDDDCVFVLSTVCEMEVTRLWHKDTPDLSQFDLVVLPGGFSYGDYLRCGAIAALSPIMEKVKAYVASGGYLMGICNGFQMLCELKLLPGVLVRNESLNFVCSDAWTRVATNQSAWTRAAKEGELLRLPIAHGDGRYVVTEEQYHELKAGNQILLTYCESSGKETPGANPNGSVHNIAGVCDKSGHVFGLMPHPERASDLRSRDGLAIWKSILQTLREKMA